MSILHKLKQGVPINSIIQSDDLETLIDILEIILCCSIKTNMKKICVCTNEVNISVYCPMSMPIMILGLSCISQVNSFNAWIKLGAEECRKYAKLAKLNNVHFFN